MRDVAGAKSAILNVVVTPAVNVFTSLSPLALPASMRKLVAVIRHAVLRGLCD
jgi:hypothetical protein